MVTWNLPAVQLQISLQLIAMLHASWSWQKPLWMSISGCWETLILLRKKSMLLGNWEVQDKQAPLPWARGSMRAKEYSCASTGQRCLRCPGYTRSYVRRREHVCAEWERQTCHLQQLVKFECTEKHSGAMYRHYIYLIMSWSLIKKIRDPWIWAMMLSLNQDQDPVRGLNSVIYRCSYLDVAKVTGLNNDADLMLIFCRKSIKL